MTSRERQTGQIKLPARWPKDVRYLQSCHFHASITPALRDFVKGNPSIAAHPANGQYGLFTTSHIKPNSRILDYIGEIHSDDRPASDYDLCLHRFPDGLSLGIDAHGSGNEARFINDYRGISKRPNAVFREIRLSSGELRMSIWSTSERIRKGDEILVSYGKSWWQARAEH